MIGLWLVTAFSGCVQMLGDDYALPCADVEPCGACFNCAFQDACAPQSAECGAVCLAYVDCINADGCSESSCEDGCSVAHPAGREPWDALYECGDALCEDCTT